MFFTVSAARAGGSSGIWNPPSRYRTRAAPSEVSIASACSGTTPSTTPVEEIPASAARSNAAFGNASGKYTRIERFRGNTP
jgi:hypothetical protein